MKQQKIAIVGSGVAGMSLALLAKSRGFNVCIFEKKPTISTLGAGVTLWPNAVFILKEMGVYDSLRPFFGVPESVTQCNEQGLPFNTLSIKEIEQYSGHKTATILRQNLISVLYKHTMNSGVSFEFNRPITADKLDRLSKDFDLVVGADGRLNSVVRQALYPDKCVTRFHDFINIIGISPWHKDAHSITEFRGHKQRFGLVPVAKNLCYWAAAWRCTNDKERAEQSWFDEVQKRFHDWHPSISKVINSAHPNSKKAILVHDVDVLPYWHQGNLIVIGDAAHASLPTSGQGVGQALEDAWHLSAILAKSHNLDEGLQAFYRLRIDKVTLAQQTGRNVASSIFDEDFGSLNSHKNKPFNLPSPQSLSKIWMNGLTHS